MQQQFSSLDSGFPMEISLNTRLMKEIARGHQTHTLVVSHPTTGYFRITAPTPMPGDIVAGIVETSIALASFPA